MNYAKDRGGAITNHIALAEPASINASFRNHPNQTEKLTKIDIGAQLRYFPPVNVSITSELEAFVESQVSNGMYKSASEVVRAALRQMATQQRKIDELEHVLDKRLQDMQREELAAGFWETLREQARGSKQSS